MLSNRPRKRQSNTLCLCGHLRSQHHSHDTNGMYCPTYDTECIVCECSMFVKDDGLRPSDYLEAHHYM